jgi:hypothetical protein
LFFGLFLPGVKIDSIVWYGRQQGNRVLTFWAFDPLAGSDQILWNPDSGITGGTFHCRGHGDISYAGTRSRSLGFYAAILMKFGLSFKI